MKAYILYLIFHDLQLQPWDIPKLRGYFSHKLFHYTELHNHLPDGKFNYSFPKVQYRIINKHPALIGIKDGIDVLRKIFFSTKEIILDQGGQEEIYPIQEIEIQFRELSFGETDQFIEYEFQSPWLALNEENYKTYKKTDSLTQQKLLKKILRGNLLSLSKGFYYTIQDLDKIQVEGYFSPKEVHFKNQIMQAFTGKFMINFHIPDWMGLGKQAARGFGVIKKQEISKRR